MRLRIIKCETPVTRLNAVEEFLELPFKVYCKHDELTGFLTSGNKVRKLEFLLYDALRKNVDTVFTCGGIQSNHCRATAVAARQLGLDTVLFLRKKEDTPIQGNLLLDHMVGSRIEYVTEEEYRDIDAIFSSEKKIAESTGKKVYVIPEGGSNALGALGYVEAAREISHQLDLDEISAVYCAVGSVGTYAGMLAGLRLAGSKARALGINVTAASAETHREKAKALLQEMAHYGFSPRIRDKEIEILDGFQGPAYAVPSAEDLDLIRTLAKRTAFFLDPVYTAKAFRGALYTSREQFRNKNILFVHTGGIFSLFQEPQKYVEVPTRSM